jgi:hypothetical protein
MSVKRGNGMARHDDDVVGKDQTSPSPQGNLKRQREEVDVYAHEMMGRKK